MAQNLDKNRRNLYKIIKENFSDITLSEFEAHFVSKDTFEEFVRQLEKNKKKKEKGKTWNKITFSGLESYYRMYACDMPWAKKLGYCGGEESEVNLDSLVGIYTTNDPKIKKIEVYKGKDENDVDSLFISSIFFKNIPQLEDYTVAKLIPEPNGINLFSISSNGVKLSDATISFVNDQFILKYKILLKEFSITGTKEKTATSEPTDKKDNKKKTDSVTSTTTKTDTKKSEIPVVKSKPLYFDKNKKDALPTKDCGDFPFTLGCVNTKIGDLSAKFFSGDRSNDTYDKELENFLDNMGYFPNSSKEITQDLWIKLMNKSIIKESVKKVLKEHINKK